MRTRTCLIGQSNLFKAGLKRLFMHTPFEVAEEKDTVRESHDLSWDEGLFLIDKPNDIREIEDDIAILKQSAHGRRVVLLAESMETDQLALSFAAGVDGYLLEEISPEALLESLALVMLGEKVFPSRLAVLLCGKNWAMPRPNHHLPADGHLSERELEIVRHLTEGLPNKVIANELLITEATVKVHVKTILKKLGVANRTQVAIWAVHNGLAILPEALTAKARSETPRSAA